MKRAVATALFVFLLLSLFSCAGKREATGDTDTTALETVLSPKTVFETDPPETDDTAEETQERWMPIFEWETDRSAYLILGDPDPVPDPVPETLPETEAVTEAETEEETTAETPLYYPTVFMYHAVNDTPFTPNEILFVRPSEVEAQIKAALSMGYETLFADEFGPREEKAVILTFDDGYEDNYTYLFPILKKYNAKATVYLITDKLDKENYLKTWQVKEMAESGLVQFGSHTVYHPYLSRLDADGVRYEMSASNSVIERITGERVRTIAYPTGDYNDTVLEIARELYDFGYSMEGGRYTGKKGEDAYTIPRFAILRGVSAKAFLKFLY